MPMNLSERTTEKAKMSIIDRVTPVLARIVMGVAIISVFAAGFAAYTFSEPRLIAYALFAIIAGAYASRVTRQEAATGTVTESENNIRPMAA